MIAVITEPMTMLTDYVLAALSLEFSIQLWRRAEVPRRRGIQLWLFAFVLIALAALVGGSYHGFRPYLQPETHARVWDLTILLIAASTLLTLAASIRSVLRPMIAAGERRKTGHRWLWRGLFISLAGVAVQQGGWGVHQHFNHNDLYHVIQMAGIYCLYRVALILENLESSQRTR